MLGLGAVSRCFFCGERSRGGELRNAGGAFGYKTYAAIEPYVEGLNALVAEGQRGMYRQERERDFGSL